MATAAGAEGAVDGPVYVSRRLTDGSLATLRRASVRLRLREVDEPPSADELLAGVVGAAAVICTLTDRIDEGVLDAAGPSLRIVANVAVGTDNIDLDAAHGRGVVVTNTPRVLDDATADLAMGLIIAACRRIAEGDRFLRAGKAWIWGPTFFLGQPVAAATLGIVCYGRIGQAVAARAKAFGMTIIATGGRFLAEHGSADGIRAVDLDELLAEADVVSLHCPLTAATRGLIGAEELRRMRTTAVLVNTARGPLIDEDALVAALRNGQIAGAGLDVFAEEPKIHPGLLEADNVVLTPHLGSADTAARERMCNLAVDNVLAVLAGRSPLTPVTSA
jgi:lactate dehydrogenase-like 2-hydroxyacid dehydrogenase